jgi:hypothetical protein
MSREPEAAREVLTWFDDSRSPHEARFPELFPLQASDPCAPHNRDAEPARGANTCADTRAVPRALSRASPALRAGRSQPLARRCHTPGCTVPQREPRSARYVSLPSSLSTACRWPPRRRRSACAACAPRRWATSRWPCWQRGRPAAMGGGHRGAQLRCRLRDEEGEEGWAAGVEVASGEQVVWRRLPLSRTARDVQGMRLPPGGALRTRRRLWRTKTVALATRERIHMSALQLAALKGRGKRRSMSCCVDARLQKQFKKAGRNTSAHGTPATHVRACPGLRRKWVARSRNHALGLPKLQ